MKGHSFIKKDDGEILIQKDYYDFSTLNLKEVVLKKNNHYYKTVKDNVLSLSI